MKNLTFLVALSLTACGGSGQSATPAARAPALRDAVVSWVAPTANTNGTPLTDLAGFRLHYGTVAQDIPNPLAVTYTVWNIPHGTWTFYVTAYNAAGEESAPSEKVTVSK
jgi:hypothetical protein